MSVSRAGTIAEEGTSSACPRRWLAAVVMMVAALMDLVDVTIVNVALPTIRRDLHAGATALEWVVSAYLLGFAVSLITAGRLGDLLGRKRLFLAGAAGFGLASLACALARSPAELIAFRAVQGVGAATMVPQVLASFRALFAGRERAAAFGMYGAVAGTASALGLLAGGALTSADLFGWGWRAVFAVNVPVAAVAVAAGLLVVPETREAGARRPELSAVVLLTGSLGAVVYPLMAGQRLGWPVWGWVLLAAGVAGLGSLVVLEAGRRETSHEANTAPLINPRLLRAPAFGAGLLVQLCLFVGMQGFFFVFALWLQAGQGYSPLHAGLVTVAFSAGGIAVAGPAVQLAPRLGRWILVAGGVLLAAGSGGVYLAAHHAGHGIGPWPLVPGLLVAGAGLSLTMIPLVNVVLAAVPAEIAGGASGIFTTVQQLGGAVGVALAGALFFAEPLGGGLTRAFDRAMPLVIAVFFAAALLALGLPRTAVADVYE